MTERITLEEAQKQVGDLERYIERGVQAFHERTGLHVADLNIGAIDVTDLGDARGKYSYRIIAEVLL